MGCALAAAACWGGCGDSLLPGTVLSPAPASGARRWTGRRRCLLVPGAVVALCLGSAPWWGQVATGPQFLLGPDKTGKAGVLGTRLLWGAAPDPGGQSCWQGAQSPHHPQTAVAAQQLPSWGLGRCPTPTGPESLGASLSSLCQGQDLALVGAFGTGLRTRPRALGWQAHFSRVWQRRPPRNHFPLGPQTQDHSELTHGPQTQATQVTPLATSHRRRSQNSSAISAVTPQGDDRRGRRNEGIWPR